jgi:hypothetical protein
MNRLTSYSSPPKFLQRQHRMHCPCSRPEAAIGNRQRTRHTIHRQIQTVACEAVCRPSARPPRAHPEYAKVSVHREGVKTRVALGWWVGWLHVGVSRQGKQTHRTGTGTGNGRRVDGDVGRGSWLVGLPARECCDLVRDCGFGVDLPCCETHSFSQRHYRRIGFECLARTLHP